MRWQKQKLSGIPDGFQDERQSRTQVSLGGGRGTETASPRGLRKHSSADTWVWASWSIFWISAVCVKLLQSCLTLCNPTDCSSARLLCPWNSPGKNTGVGCLSLLQGISPTRGPTHVSYITSPAWASSFFTTSNTWDFCHSPNDDNKFVLF